MDETEREKKNLDAWLARVARKKALWEKRIATMTRTNAPTKKSLAGSRKQKAGVDNG